MIPTRVGERNGGGFFTGVIRDGTTCYAIIVAPKSTEETSIPFKTSADATPNTQSVNNGWTNTNSMNNSSHPVAQYCRNMTAGSYTDWYLPSRDELELCYRYLTPGTGNNATGSTGMSGNATATHGENLNSIPVGTPYTSTNPDQTIVTAFRTGGVEAFDAEWYWTSTEASAGTTSALIQDFSDGYQGWTDKTYTGYRVRAVRCVLIEQGDWDDTN